MAITQDDLDRLEQAMVQGVLTVTFSDGRSVTFSTFEELNARWQFVAKRLGYDAGRRRMLSEFKKGVAP